MTSEKLKSSCADVDRGDGGGGRSEKLKSSGNDVDGGVGGGGRGGVGGVGGLAVVTPASVSAESEMVTLARSSVTVSVRQTEQSH